MSESLLQSFAGTNGIYPKASVIYQGGILYGTTSDGGNVGSAWNTYFYRSRRN